MKNDKLGAIVLCGGKSSRMGHPKHLLPFGNESTIERVLRVVSEVASRIVVVAAVDQELPQLPDEIEVIRDEDEYQGPLAGLMMGLEALPTNVELAYLTGCDVPLLKSQFIEGIVQSIQDQQIAIPVEEKFLHPLAAVYRTEILPIVRSMYESGERRPRRLIERCAAKRIPVEELRGFDPELHSLRNMNSPEDYANLLELAGLN